jgi:hypothetical protein
MDDLLAYNHFIPQQAIGYRSPIDALASWYDQHFELFVAAVMIQDYNQAGRDMFPVLEDYCAIYAATHEWARKERHRRLQAWRQTHYALMPDYVETRAFLAKMERQSIVRISTPFFLKVVFPVRDVEIFQHHCLERGDRPSC